MKLILIEIITIIVIAILTMITIEIMMMMTMMMIDVVVVMMMIAILIVTVTVINGDLHIPKSLWAWIRWIVSVLTLTLTKAANKLFIFRAVFSLQDAFTLTTGVILKSHYLKRVSTQIKNISTHVAPGDCMALLDFRRKR